MKLRLETANREPPGMDEVCPKRRVIMEAPMDIARFNALLHSKKDQTQLMSALYDLTMINDLEILVRSMSPQALWGAWR
jgi:hypothetical protein